MVSTADAARLLAAGALVGLPSETVYGLAADATQASAVREVYAAKGRPPGHPLIVHVLADPEAVARVDARARALIEQWWPGPLTLVLPRGPHVLDEVTGGHATVAVRSPAHPVFREVLAALGRPIAAPSANRFGGVSPTLAAHVARDFPGLAIVDGGAAGVGVESTILDLSGAIPALLRPGAVDRAALEAVLGPIRVGGDTAAPGTLPSHYAPRAAVHPTDDPDAVLAELLGRGLRVGVIRASEPDAYAARLYADLRRLDEAGHEVIVVEWSREEGVGSAINDRIRRAAAPRSAR